MFALIFFSSFFGLYMCAVYKNFGSVVGHIDDRTLTIAGTVGAVCNGLSRVVWAYFVDKVRFKILYMILLVIITVLPATVVLVVQFSDILYVIYVCLNYVTIGGQYVMFPPFCLHVFGSLHGG